MSNAEALRAVVVEIPDALPDEDYLSGPFYDLDGLEIVPCTTEGTDHAIESCIGRYRLCANVEALHGGIVTIDGCVMTRFIQQDWNRLMEDERRQQGGAAPAYSVGFLAAYEGKRRAVGRLAEDVVCAEVFREKLFGEDAIERVLSVDDAIDERLFMSSGAGIRCDDVVLVTQSGRRYLGEVKASLSGRSYLVSSIPKALQQFRNSLAANEDVEGVVLTLVSIREGDKFIVILVADRNAVSAETDADWLNRYASLAPPRRARARTPRSREPR